MKVFNSNLIMTKHKLYISYGDAGGAYQLISYCIKLQKKYKIFIPKDSLEKIIPFKDLDYEVTNNNLFLGKNDIFISSTSNPKINYEFTFWEKLHKSNNEYEVILDNWCNYRDRFCRNNKKLYPSKILVTDKYAYDKCSNLFKEYCDIELIPNPLLDYLVYRIKREKIMQIYGSVLLVIPPINSIKNSDLEKISHWFYKENINSKIKVRCHPLDINRKDKLKKFIQSINNEYNSFEISRGSMWKDLGESNYVIGFDSYLIYLAFLLNKETKFISSESKSSIALQNLLTKNSQF